VENDDAVDVNYFPFFLLRSILESHELPKVPVDGWKR
jgi:hypothetical protein